MSVDTTYLTRSTVEGGRKLTIFSLFAIRIANRSSEFRVADVEAPRVQEFSNNVFVVGLTPQEIFGGD